MQTKLSDGSIMVCGMLPKDAEYKTVGANGSDLTTFGLKVGEKPLDGDVTQKKQFGQTVYVGIRLLSMQLRSKNLTLCFV